MCVNTMYILQIYLQLPIVWDYLAEQCWISTNVYGMAFPNPRLCWLFRNMSCLNESCCNLPLCPAPSDPPLTREQHGLHGHHSLRNHHGRHSHRGHPHSRTLRHKHRSQAHPESNCKTKADLAWRNTGKIETISIATHWCLIILIQILRARFVGSNVIGGVDKPSETLFPQIWNHESRGILPIQAPNISSKGNFLRWVSLMLLRRVNGNWSLWRSVAIVLIKLIALKEVKNGQECYSVSSGDVSMLSPVCPLALTVNHRGEGTKLAPAIRFRHSIEWIERQKLGDCQLKH